MMEKTKHAELLLEFDANAFAKNEHGQTPQDLIPRDAVRSTKLFFKKMFEVCVCVCDCVLLLLLLLLLLLYCYSFSLTALFFSL